MGRRRWHRKTPRTRPVRTAHGAPESRREPRIWPSALVLLLLGSVTYATSLDGAFVMDDFVAIVTNPDIRTPWSVSLLHSGWGESPLLGRPLVALTFAANYALDGLAVRGYHAVNIAIHLLCGLALFGVIRRIRHSVAFAFVCASLWLLHPLNSEAVMYVTQRTESMMALFYLLTIYASVRAHGSSRPRPWLTGAVIATALGSLSKQSMVTVPLALVLVDYAFFFDSLRSALRSRWRFYVATAATSWIAVAITVVVSPQFYSVGFGSGPSPWVYLLNQSVMITRYLMLAFWPRNLVANYGYPEPYTLTDVLPQMAFIGGLLVLTLVALRYRPKLGALGAWIFLTLAVTSSLGPVANQVGAERRMYLPLAAVVILAVLPVTRAADHLTRRRGIPARTVAVGSAVLWTITGTALAARTIDRAGDYTSPLRLAEVNFERWPASYTRHGLAEELLLAGRRDEAIAHLREAVPDDPRAHFTLGRALFEEGNLREAREHLEAFIREQPLLVQAVDAHALLGRARLAEGEFDAAIEQFQQVLQMQPSFYDAHLGLAKAFTAQGRHDEAVTQYLSYFAEGGTNPAVWTDLGVALAQAGRHDEAMRAFREAATRDPSASAPYRNLAAMLMEQGDVAAAVRHAERAVALNPGDATTRDLFGVTLAAQGRTDEAVRQWREALRLDPLNATAREHLDEALRRR